MQLQSGLQEDTLQTIGDVAHDVRLPPLEVIAALLGQSALSIYILQKQSGDNSSNTNVWKLNEVEMAALFLWLYESGKNSASTEEKSRIENNLAALNVVSDLEKLRRFPYEVLFIEKDRAAILRAGVKLSESSFQRQIKKQKKKIKNVSRILVPADIPWPELRFIFTDDDCVQIKSQNNRVNEKQHFGMLGFQDGRNNALKTPNRLWRLLRAALEAWGLDPRHILPDSSSCLNHHIPIPKCIQQMNLRTKVFPSLQQLK